MTQRMSANTLIDCHTLSTRLGNDNWRVFDCRFDLADTERGASAYAAGHIPGAYYAHLDHDLSAPITADTGRHPLPDPNRLIDWLGAHGIGPDTQVIAYDDTGGNMAVRLWWLLRWLGHTRVAVLDGGWPAWDVAGLPCETTAPPKPRSTDFGGRPDWHQVVDTEQIERQLRRGTNDIQLLDVRTEERFRGDAEPIDPVAGHIPGALNLPLQLNLTDDGRFKDAQTLARMYRAALGDIDPGRVALMCGSGVTACHGLLAMEIAGLHGAKLYAGSWSEWIRDPTRPIATGD